MLRDIKMLFLQTIQILHSFEALNWKENTNPQALTRKNKLLVHLIWYWFFKWEENNWNGLVPAFLSMDKNRLVPIILIFDMFIKYNTCGF